MRMPAAEPRGAASLWFALAAAIILIQTGCASRRDTTPASAAADAQGDVAAGEAATDSPSAADAALTAAADASIDDVSAGDEGESVGAESGDATGAADVASTACLIRRTPPASPGTARSAGYSGSESAYLGLFGLACESATDCTSACTAAGGTAISCEAGSQCLPGNASDGGSGCNPTSYWQNASSLGAADGGTGTLIILVDAPAQDSLIVENFGLTLPSGATVTGIYVAVERVAADENARDADIELLKDGVPTGSNRASSQPWPASPRTAYYGGAYDTWGTTWTADDVSASGFGVTITPAYTGPALANERASVTSVKVTIYFRACP